MNYTILGTGAIGGYYGSKLQKAGIDVNFIARSDYQYIKDNGLKISSIDGDFTLPKVSVFNSVDETPMADVVIVSTKTTSNSMLPKLLKPIIKDGTIILVLQNGMGMEEELQKAFPQAKIIGGMCFICSQKLSDGHIGHFDQGTISAVPFNVEDMDLLKLLQEDFTVAGIKFSVFENLIEQRWKKLMWNIPFNSLSVILNADTGEIMNNANSLSIAKKLMLEVVEGAKSQGCNIEAMVEVMINVTYKMTPYKPSMRVDYDFNRPLEIEYMFENPIAIAKANGVEMPLTELITKQLLFLCRNI